MRRRWDILFTFLIVVVVGIGIFIYNFNGNNDANSKVEQITFNYKNVKKEAFGSDWEDYSESGKDDFKGLVFVKVVSDGQLIKEKIPIKTKEGKSLATAVLSFRGSFYNKEGDKATLTIPMLIRLKDGSLIHPAINKRISWSQRKIDEEIISNPPLFGAKPGLVERVGVLISNEDKKYFSDVKESTRSKYLSVIFEYNTSWKEELGVFASTGVADFDILLPFSLSIGRQVIVIEDF